MARRFVLALVPSLAIAAGWLQVERTAEWAPAVALATLAAATAIPAQGRSRLVAALAAGLAGLAVALDTPLTRPGAAEEELRGGLVAFYEVPLPFDPARDTAMAALVLAAVLASSLLVTQFAAAGRIVLAAAVAAVATAWPATLMGGTDDLLYGALALGAALWLLIASRRRPLRTVLVGACAGLAVLGAAVAAASTGAGAREAGLDWRHWDLLTDAAPRFAVAYAWDADYGGISFPAKATTVLKVRADRRPRYWRASSLDVFSDDRWLEELRPYGVARGRRLVPLDDLQPAAAARRDAWLEQRVEITALRDTRLVAAGAAAAFDLRGVGSAQLTEDGTLQVPVGLRRGDRYTVWSYVADPVPRVLAAARPVYPPAARRYLQAFGQELPPFGAPGRARTVEALVRDPARTASSYAALYERAVALAGDERSPYRVVLALESWLRSRGGFRYDEQPPHTPGVPPLVDFVTTTRAGYCQHFAGAMALMLRMLGIPSRVAVGFTSGSLDDDAWVVTDHDAHAWVEVWFPEYGWIPFDPTPGRGRLTGAYSFASESARAVAELGAGRLPGADEVAQLARTPAPALRDGAGSRVPPAGALLLLVPALAAALLLAKQLRTGWRYRARDPRSRAAAARAELVAFLRDQGLGVGPASTTSELGAAVAAAYGVRLDTFAAAFGRARFGAAPDAEDAREARRELRRALRAVRGRLGVWRRARGALSTRSFRGG
jgi:transglutaminase-like putative cysteine protease